MTSKEKNIYKKLLSSCIVLSMVLTGFATMMIVGPVDTVKAGGTIEDPSLRIYGEKDAVYPTHSYMGCDDFYYNNETQPFDPGVIEKDSLTFNPALIGLDWTSPSDGIDYDEKVFLRAFYEPGYQHGTDIIMPGPDGGSCNIFDAVVTETSYMLIDDSYAPYAASVPVAIKLPANKDAISQTPGMEILEDVTVGKAYSFGTANPVDGGIEVSMTLDVGLNEEVTFMDHNITITGRFYDSYMGTDCWQYKATIGYLGNYDGYHHSSVAYPNTGYSDIGIPEKNYCFFSRSNDRIIDGPQGMVNNPAYRWFVKVINYDEDNLVTTIKIGRQLVAGETFYVDGVRYDMPAICVNSENKFKYITLQTPIPKARYDNDDEDVTDNSHVDSQWLERLDSCPEIVWMLPPFDDDHIMIDDIGLSKLYLDSCVIDGMIVDGPLPNGMVGPLEFCWSEETIEPRFNTSIVERLFADYVPSTDLPKATDGDDYEWWEWFGVHTLPDHFTSFVLPDQENSACSYVDECPGYPYSDVDGFEYLLTSSFIAPNSNLIDPNIWQDHDIIDKVQDIAKRGDTTRQLYYKEPRVSLEYDAADDTDIYVNDVSNNDISTVSVRTYGEDNAVYPTHSYYDTVDFKYEDETQPFDSGIIEKDSITFNPALIETMYTSQEPQGVDYDEKVFLRLFYEPGYSHGTDSKMPGPYGGSCQEFDAVVTETTYMLVKDNPREPYASPAGPYDATNMYDDPITTILKLPCKSNPLTSKPGMEIMEDVSVRNSEYDPTYLTYGAVDVSVNVDVGLNERIYFMDHFIEITGRHFDQIMGTQLWAYKANVGYCGNYNEYHDSMQSYPGLYSDSGLPEHWTCYFNRANHKIQQPDCPPNVAPFDDPDYRWFVKVNNYDEDNQVVSLTIGRRLFAGETFYVDGVRYDMPAIYVNDQYEFKYITLQTPIPKARYANDDEDVTDNSHVDSQWLERLDSCPEIVWMLPPFTEQHLMIDDIGLEKTYPDGENPFFESCAIRGIKLAQPVAPLKFCWHEETIEPRFNTSLVERLISNDRGTVEKWSWFGVYTLPNKFTSFVLPDQEHVGDSYDEPCVDSGVTADGFEYLITSSYLAPNSNLINPNNWYKHDVIDHVLDIALCGERAKFINEPRVAFEHDGSDDTGIYINAEVTCHPPVAVDDTASVDCGGNFVYIDVLGNDYDPDVGDTITLYSKETDPAEGYAQIFGDEFRYESPACDSGKTYPYDVSFEYKIKDSQGYHDTAIVTITIDDNSQPDGRPPTACFVWSPEHPDVCEEITFDACTSIDDDDGDSIDDGTIISYSWDWNNDGDFNDAGEGPFTTCSATHSWCSAGVYTVRLKVVDNEGDSDIVSHDIPVGCLVDLYFDYQTINVPQQGSSQVYSLMIDQGTQDVGLVNATISWDPYLVDIDPTSITFNTHFNDNTAPKKYIDAVNGHMTIVVFNWTTFPQVDWIVKFSFDGKNAGTDQVDIAANKIGANDPIVDITAQTCGTASGLEVTNGGGCTPGDIYVDNLIDEFDLLALGNIIYGPNPIPTSDPEFCRCNVYAGDAVIDGLDYLALGTMVYGGP